jgi:methylation protein EvaC
MRQYTICKYSNKKIPVVMSFGNMPIANNFSKKKSKKTNFNMKIAFNEEYKLLQLVDTPPAKELFNSNYAFLSSTSKSMSNHFYKVSKIIKKKFLKKNGNILEIGCNDGIFLKNFIKYNHLGIEPSKNVYKIAKSKGLNVINSFFNTQLVKKKQLLFDCIYSANVICHIPNIKELFGCIKKILNKNGVFIFEDPYLGDILKKTSYDQIYDEHFYYFCLTSINKIANDFGLEVFNVEKINTHGGSMRYYISYRNFRKINKIINKINFYEKVIINIKALKRFKQEIIKSRRRILKIINKYKKYKIYGYGATSKSSTIINYCKINNKMIRGIFDTSSTKINKYTPKSNIKIIDYNKFKKINPKYCFLFAWNHYKEILKKEKNNKIRWITHINKGHFKNYKNFFI